MKNHGPAFCHLIFNSFHCLHLFGHITSAAFQNTLMTTVPDFIIHTFIYNYRDIVYTSHAALLTSSRNECYPLRVVLLKNHVEFRNYKFY